jgi:hypothetical protein
LRLAKTDEENDMDIKFSGSPTDGMALVSVYLDDDLGENMPLQSAQVDLWVPFDDSLEKMHASARSALATFLQQALEALESSNPE